MTPHELNPNDPLMPSADVAKYLGVQIPALEKWRQLGTGPDYVKVGRLVRYKKSALDAWLTERTIIPNAGNDLTTAA